MCVRKALDLCAQHSLLLKEQKIIPKADQMWTCSQLSSTADVRCIKNICSQMSNSESRILPAHFTASERSSTRNDQNSGWDLVSSPQYTCTYDALNPQLLTQNTTSVVPQPPYSPDSLQQTYSRSKNYSS